MKQRYEAYVPTKWERRIDALFGLASTKIALRRMINRERMNWFRYLAAQPTTARPNSPITTTGEWLRIQREKAQVMWNAIDMVDNSGLCSGIQTKFPTYICGTLRWQARTGDKDVNTAYQQYIQNKTGKPGNIDIQGRSSLRQQCILDVKSIMLKGDVGTNIVREDGELYLQGIEANRIGDPYKWQTTDTYVRGLTLDKDTGRIESVRVFYQDRRSGTYKFDGEFPTRDKRGLPQFLFFTNPISYDDYRGVSLYKHAIDNSTYIDRMRQYELQALLWAASQSGVYYTKSGALPEALPFSRTPVVDKDGNTIETFATHPNTLVALSADGEKVEMFQHDRPSPNVIGMYENTIIDISVGAGLTKQFTWGMTGTGPEVRMASAQDARAVDMWQQMLRECKLDNVIMLLLGDAIAKGIVPYHENWLTWDWYFPAKPTIDVGRESEANIEEMNACVNTGANVVAESGQGDVEEVIIQRSHEVGMMIDAAQEEAKKRNLPWEQVYALMVPPPRGRGQGAGMPAAANVAAGKVAGQNPDKAGASDEGVEIDGGNGSGSKVGRFRIQDGNVELLYAEDGDIKVIKLYRPDQARGAAGTPEGGQFVPEVGGGGAGAGGGGGTAVATQKKTETKAQESPLDRAIADYKPDRSLGDPKKRVPITSIVKDTTYTPYSKTPFFDDVNVLQGAPKDDPLKYGIKDYVEQRDLLFNTIPVTKVSLADAKNVVITQENVNTDRIQQLIDQPDTGGTKAIQAVKQGGKLYILNGHHRVTALMKGGGEKQIDAHVLDLDYPEPAAPKSDAELPGYVEKLHAAPAYKTITDRLKALGSGEELESWSLRKHTGPDGKLSPEQRAVHEGIINQFLSEGGGKGFVTIGADNVRLLLPDYRGWNTPATQEEAKMITVELAKRAAAARRDMIFDEVGSKPEKATAKVEAFANAGYDVHVMHVDAPMYETIPRAWKRFKEQGRFTDPGYQLSAADDKPYTTYKLLKDNPKVTSWEDVDNEGFKGIVRDKGQRSEPVKGRPQMVLLIGKPAAGKTTAWEKRKAELGL